MHWWRFAVLIVIATVLQTSFLGVVWLGRPEIRPDLLLILLVFFAVNCKANDAVIASFAIGLAADLASPVSGFMGPKIISFGLFGTLLSDLNNVISIRRLPYQGVAIFIMGLATVLAAHLLAHLRGAAAPLNAGPELFWQPLLSALLGPFLCLPLAWWMHINKKKRRRGKWRF